MTSGGILWCGVPGCRNHVHLGPEAAHILPSGWSYYLRRRGWQAECPSCDHGLVPVYDRNPAQQPVAVDGEG